VLAGLEEKSGHAPNIDDNWLFLFQYRKYLPFLRSRPSAVLEKKSAADTLLMLLNRLEFFEN
jgi:hypothetical protein